MTNVSLRTKLIGVFAIPIIALIILAYASHDSLAATESSFSELDEVSLPVVTALEELKVSGSQLVSSTNEFVLDGVLGIEGGDEDEGEEEDIEAAIESYHKSLETYRSLVTESDADDFELLADIETSGQVVLNTSAIIVGLQEDGAPIDDIVEAREEIEAAEINFFLAVDAAIDEEREELEGRASDVHSTVGNATNFTLGVTIATFFVMVGIAFFIFQSIFRPLSKLRATAENLRQGDLSTRSDITSQDELGQFASVFNTMAESIQAREKSLKELNQSLEQRVDERTVELKKSRDEALALQRIAKENSRLKSEFLATMSHELRTPLNAIEGFTSIMLSGMGVELSERAEDMVKRVSSNSKRLLQLINDFLDLSRIEAGRMELVNSPLSITDLASKWQREVGVLAEEKGLDFVVTIDPELPHEILGDEDALSKMAINLLGNAFKFTKEGQVSLDFQRVNGNWTIAVSDTGIGIPAHAREFIFDEFRQVDGSSKRLFGGTGLGLSLVQKLSRALGGNVALQSEVGKGSTFTVTLPLEVAQPNEEGVIA